jgi:transposase
MSLAELVILSVKVEGRSKSEVARDYRISRYWVHQLVRRYEAEGEAAYTPRSRRPRTNPRAVDAEVEERIVRLSKELSKKGWDAGADTIRSHRERDPTLTRIPAVSTIWRILVRRGFVVPQPHKRPESAGHRFEAAMPNERWQSDTTHWQLADGTEVEILNIEDDHSRLDLASDARYSTGGDDVVTSFRRAFRRYGIPARVLTRQCRDLHRQTPTRWPGRPGARARRPRGQVRPLPTPAPADLRQGGEVPPDPEEVAGRPTTRIHPGRPATPAGPVPPLLQHRPTYQVVRRQHRAIGRRTPAQAYAARPKATPAGPRLNPHYRVRRDRTDGLGVVTLRYDSRLRHIGLGREHARRRVFLLIADLDVRVIDAETGQLLRDLILDPTRDYQPLGRPPGPPKRT